MLTVLLCVASAGAGIVVGGLSVRASMDHLVRSAQVDLDIALVGWEALIRRHSNALDTNARLRRQNAALRERCGAPPELVTSDLQVAS